MRTKNHNLTELGLVSRYTDSPFGSLHYVTVPHKQSNEVMLFFHGFGTDWTMWLPMLRAIRQQALLQYQDVIFIDLPGFGASQNTAKHLNLKQLGDAIVTLCAGLGYKKIRLTGHSMGSFLALDIAARHPEVASVHIVAGGYFRLNLVGQHPLKYARKYPLVGLYYFASTLFGGRSFSRAAQNGKNYDAPKIWSQISADMYGVYGGRDKLVSRVDMEQMQLLQPAAKLAIIQNGRHGLPMTHPTEVTKTLYSSI